MKSISIKLLVFVAVMLVGSSVYAGLADVWTVWTTTGAMYGEVSAARFSADTRQFIACDTYISGGAERAYCSASDAAGNYKNCMTSDQHMVNIARSVNSISYVYFTADASGTCNYIDVENGSQYLH